MSETSSTTPPASEQAPVPAPAPAKPKSGLALAAMILGILAMVAAVIPGLSFVAFVPALTGLVLGIVALATKTTERVKALVGVILGPIAIIVAIIVSVAFVASTITPNATLDKPAAEQSQAAEPQEPAEPAAPEVGTRENPAPAGSTVEISDNSGPIWNVTLGAATLNANDVIAAENQFNDPADAGSQYVLVPITYTYVGTQTGTPWIDVEVVFVTASGTTHEQEFVVVPSPITDISELYPGGSATGNLVVMVPSADIESGAWAIGSLFGDKFFVAVQ